MSYKNIKIIFKINLKDHIKNHYIKHYYYDEPEQSEESDFYVTEIRRRPKRQQKRIIYGDEIDGLPEYAPNSPTDEDQEEGVITKTLQNQ